MRLSTVRTACLALSVSLIAASASSAQEMLNSRGYPVVGVKLSERELDRSRPVRLSDGRVVLRPRSEGLPFLFGLGDASGAPSGLPTVNGVTPSVAASTPSGGLVPGQTPR